MAKFIHIDSLNMFFRSIHTVQRGASIDMKSGMALHTIFNSIRKVWREFGGDHIIFHEEGRSWRKSFDALYKANRDVAKSEMSEREREDQQILLEAFNDMSTFLKEKTNVTVLRCPVAEADDTIAIFIQDHPEDEHIIISSDSDFIQLLKTPNVTLYNGVTGVTFHKDYVLNDKGKKCSFEVTSGSKVKVGKPDANFVPDSNWVDYALFLKIIRGDSSDNIMSAFPGARVKGTKNKVGINEAYEDRNNKGFKWNNFMLSRWTDHNEIEHVVKDRYDHNRTLIDLTMQPEEIKQAVRETIQNAKNRPDVSNIGIHFMKFCGRWDLNRVSDSAQEFANMLKARVDY